jgi:hypothetical protein
MVVVQALDVIELITTALDFWVYKVVLVEEDKLQTMV